MEMAPTKPKDQVMEQLQQMFCMAGLTHAVISGASVGLQVNQRSA